MKVFIYGSKTVRIIRECADLVEHTDEFEICDILEESDVAVAPLLQELIPASQINAPRLGTLILHPSLLPQHRGRDAIKWAFRMGQTYSGITWFWADEGIDTGPVCEMEVLAIKEGERPREFYERAVIPATVRLLAYILNDLKVGFVSKRPQIEENATYERPLVLR